MSEENAPQPITAADYIAPMVGRLAFHCPFCRVYAQQRWQRLGKEDSRPTRARLGICQNCQEESLWWTNSSFQTTSSEDTAAVMLWPRDNTTAPPPHVDLPSDVREDYNEARSIVDRSPRGAAALLRLALQKLMRDLGEPGRDINKDIGSLVSKGLPVEVQQALDALRVIGNESVHPGSLDMTDDIDTATTLFRLLNFIVEQRITQPKKLQQLYNSLPASKLAGIQQRDTSSPSP